MEINEFTIEIVETPGHSFDHVSFIIDNYVFFGDLVISPRQIVAMRGENMVWTIDSLEKILKYDFELAFGGVGVYTRGDVEEYLNYLRNLKKKMDNLYSKGFSIEGIVKSIFPHPSQKALLMEEFSGGEWSRINMVKALLGLE